MNKTPLINLSLAAFGLASFASVGSAQTFAVDFGGNYSPSPNASGNVAMSRGWTELAGYGDGQAFPTSIPVIGAEVAFDNSSPLLNLSPISGGASGKVYGAAVRYNGQADDANELGYTGNTDGNANLIASGGPGDAEDDRIQIDTKTLITSENQFGMNLYWKKADFLSGYSAATLDFSIVDEISVTIQNGQFQSAGQPTNVHWMVQDGAGDFFVSQSTATSIVSQNTWFTGTETGVGLAGLDWVAYDPTASGAAIYIDPSSASTATLDSSDLQSVGIYATNLDYGGRIAARTGAFSVSVIPEPSAFSFLFGVLTLGLIAGRRRRIAC